MHAHAHTQARTHSPLLIRDLKFKQMFTAGPEPIFQQAGRVSVKGSRTCRFLSSPRVPWSRHWPASLPPHTPTGLVGSNPLTSEPQPVKLIKVERSCGITDQTGLLILPVPAFHSPHSKKITAPGGPLFSGGCYCVAGR